MQTIRLVSLWLLKLHPLKSAIHILNDAKKEPNIVISFDYFFDCLFTVE